MEPPAGRPPGSERRAQTDRRAGLAEVGQFACDPERARDFAETLGSPAADRHSWPLVWNSFRTAFRDGLNPVSPNADLNQQIAESVASALPGEIFESPDLPRSLWMLRISRAVNDAEESLEQLLHEKRA